MDFYECAISDAREKDLKEAFDAMEGGTVNKIGFVNVNGTSHLAIDYRKGGLSGRVVIGYSELGMWKHWSGELGKLSDKDELTIQTSKFSDNLKGDVYLREEPKSLKYFICGHESAEEIEIRAEALKRLPDDEDCNALRECFMTVEKDAEEIFEILMSMYAKSGY